MSPDAASAESAPFRICFVCTGNICRSPMAETVFRSIATRAGYGDAVRVTSAGTGDWHVGEPADPRTITALAASGYDGSAHRAKQFDPQSFDDLDLVVAFDSSHERILRSWARSDQDRMKVQLLLSFDREQAALGDVADPYYSDAAMFASTLAVIEHACHALFDQIRPALRQGAA